MSQRSIYEIQADFCRSMASATRIRIVHVLRDEPQRVGDIARLIGLPPMTVSRHLGVLRSGGIVVAQRRARGTLYQIANPKIVYVCDLMREVLVEEASRRSRLVEASPDEYSR
jgi:ArsR family transcriptional regulator, virulence genes transcriptional regulator